MRRQLCGIATLSCTCRVCVTLLVLTYNRNVVDLGAYHDITFVCYDVKKRFKELEQC